MTIFFALFSLLFFRKINTLSSRYPFLTEMLERSSQRFFAFPTAIKMGRAIFAPLRFLLFQKKHDKNSSQGHDPSRTHD